MEPAVSIVVPTFRRASALRETLAALVELDFPPDQYEVIVVDDGSRDATASVVKKFQGLPVAVSYHEQRNSGVAAARNAGARLARGDLIVFVDDDIIVERDHIERHLAARAAFPESLVNGHWEFTPELSTALRATPFGRFRLWIEEWVREDIAKRPLAAGRKQPREVTACNLGIPRRLFWELGGFDETFPYAGCEDQELSLRAAAAGCQFVYDEAIKLLHNDHRLSLEAFCERQERGAVTAVHLASRHPAEWSRPMLVENGRLDSGDGFRLAAKKVMKLILSRRAAIRVLHSLIRIAERIRLPEAALRRGYWVMTGVYIFRGVRSGLKKHP